MRTLTALWVGVCVSACARTAPEPEPAIPPTVAAATFDSVWQIVNHTHFDTTFNGVNWASVKSELRPRLAGIHTNEDLRDLLREMVGRLHQSHFDILPSEAVSARGDSVMTDIGQVGMSLRWIDGAMVVERVDPAGGAALAGVHAGWIVRRVEDVVIADMVAEFPRSPLSHYPGITADIVATTLFYGPARTAVRAQFVGANGTVESRDIMREKAEGVPVKFGNLPVFVSRLESARVGAGGAPTVGVIRFNFWMVPMVPAFDRAIDSLRTVDGIIIDLRDNAGGYAPTVSGIAGHFFSDRALLGTVRSRSSESKILANPRVVTAAGRRVTPYAGPVAILVGPRTGSASEVFTAGMQATGRARVFGEKTYGGALPATTSVLPNGDVFMHAYADFVTSAGTRPEGGGVVPDELAPPTRAALLAGHDSAYDAAVQWIARQRTAITRQGKQGGD